MQISMFDGSQPLKIKKPIRLIELFAGIGAQAKALERLGVDFEHYRVVEFDKYAIMSYNAIHNTNFPTIDITQIHANDLGIVDTDKYDYIMTYSFPCTDLSTIGKQAGMKSGSGTRSGLLWEVERLLKETKELPQFLLMENVPAILSKKFIEDFAAWLSFLNSLGYTSKWEILNAKDYGVPQNRERCFMLSWIAKDCYYDFPNKQNLNVYLQDLLDKNVEDKYYLKNISPNTWLGKKINKIIMKYGYLPKYFNCYDEYEIIDIAPCVTTKCDIAHSSSSICIVEDKGIRKCTPKERWRQMGFDDIDFENASSVNSDTQLYKEAGNSIVVNVLMDIFKEILK